MNMQYAIDLSLRPTTFDFWHVCLASAVLVLALILIFVLLSMVIGMSRCRKKHAAAAVVPAAPAPAPEPVVKVVEKIVEVEKIVPGPAPEPVILKEATPDAALQLLGLLQQQARFIDFIREDLSAFNDADIGVAARVVHEGCNKVINEHFSLAPVRSEQEGGKVTLPKGFDAAGVRLTGKVTGEAPFTGTLVHKGWQVTQIRLPKLTQGYNAAIIAPAEVEL
ncbi:DUF2760 domain-containing protein [Candidatus Methylomicrobium oryzae]|uniref:DUF2760 domain-containing protein n=1 Tax=Candidatus Methylomicrobium oryzae TaxID=2802053 RepID=UPI0019251409|nr:DUF2760 domain-containing protein [Methylomicrobium sp. RS1]MBL1264920.1 DUF2760 domain-containing protein [Methylomicrobium sp. RS1]